MDRETSTGYSPSYSNASLATMNPEALALIEQAGDDRGGCAVAISPPDTVTFPNLSVGYHQVSLTGNQWGSSRNQGYPVEIDSLTVVLMAGLPGTGKTKLAYALQDELGWQVIDKDLHIMEQKERDLDDYQAAWNAYEQSFKEVRCELERYSSVILDSAALHQFILNEMTEIVRKISSVRLKVILCVANPALRKERLHTRSYKHPKSTMNLAVDIDEAQLFKHLPSNSLTLDMSEDFEENLKEAKGYVLS